MSFDNIKNQQYHAVILKKSKSHEMIGLTSTCIFDKVASDIIVTVRQQNDNGAQYRNAISLLQDAVNGRVWDRATDDVCFPVCRY
jgi:hypothetical protein